MTRYVAFLRGVNVGGHNPVRMGELRQRVEKWGGQRVATYLQSGQVIFDSKLASEEKVRRAMEEIMADMCGKEIKVVVRPFAELQKIVRLNPFAAIKTEPKHCFVSFLYAEPTLSPSLPVATPQGEITLFLIKHRAAFLQLDRSKGPYTDPDKLLKTALGTSGTIRNWNTVGAVAAMV